MSNQGLINKLESYLADLDFKDSSHDLNHFRRVLNIARIINKDEGADEEVIIAACYLHDIVSYSKNDPKRRESSLHASLKAQEILTSMNFPEEKMENLKHCIHAHSYSANLETNSLEAKIVQDADRMEAIGAIGLARCFYVSGMMGSSLFHPDDPFCEARELNDAKYAIDHFYVKLLKLKDTMKTKGGKKIAQKRTEVLKTFLTDLKSELFV